MINRFIDNFHFLSNFYVNDIYFRGKSYKSIEHAYQAFKTKNMSEHDWIRSAPTPSIAKSFGRKVKVRDDWDDIKYKLMLKLVRIKFKDDELSKKLLKTGNEELIESNYWHDNTWGDCYCNKCKEIEGKNWLGEILMKVREEIRVEKELFN